MALSSQSASLYVGVTGGTSLAKAATTESDVTLLPQQPSLSCSMTNEDASSLEQLESVWKKLASLDAAQWSEDGYETELHQTVTALWNLLQRQGPLPQQQQQCNRNDDTADPTLPAPTLIPTANTHPNTIIHEQQRLLSHHMNHACRSLHQPDHPTTLRPLAVATSTALESSSLWPEHRRRHDNSDTLLHSIRYHLVQCLDYLWSLSCVRRDTNSSNSSDVPLEEADSLIDDLTVCLRTSTDESSSKTGAAGATTADNDTSLLFGTTILRLWSRILHAQKQAFQSAIASSHHRHHRHSTTHRPDGSSMPSYGIRQWHTKRRVKAIVSVLVPMTTRNTVSSSTKGSLNESTSQLVLRAEEEEKKSDDSSSLVAVGHNYTNTSATARVVTLATLNTELFVALFRFLLDWMSSWDVTHGTRHCHASDNTSITTSFPFATFLGTVLTGMHCHRIDDLVVAAAVATVEEPSWWLVWESTTTLLWHFAVAIPNIVASHPLVWKRVEMAWTTTAVKMSSSTSHKNDATNDVDERTQIVTSNILRNLSAVIGTLAATLSTSNTTDRDDNDIATSVVVTAMIDQAWLVPSLVAMLQLPLEARKESSRTCHTDVRRRCMRTIRCLSTTDWGCNMLLTIPTSIGHVLVDILHRTTADRDVDIRILACRTWMDLWPHCVAAFCVKSRQGRKEASTTAADMIALGPSMETTLLHMIENSDETFNAESADKIVLAACQTLTASLKHSPWKRSAQCFSSALLEQLHAVLSERIDQPTYHLAFSEFLVELVRLDDIPEASSEVTSTPPTRIQGITKLLVSNPAFLDVASMLLAPSVFGPDYDVSRANTVHLLTTVVRDDPGNKKPLADDENLLSALVNVCLMTNNEGQLKDDTKQLIFELVPEL